MEKKTLSPEKDMKKIKVPVFNRIFIQDNKLIGEQASTRNTIVIENYGKE